MRLEATSTGAVDPDARLQRSSPSLSELGPLDRKKSVLPTAVRSETVVELASLGSEKLISSVPVVVPSLDQRLPLTMKYRLLPTAVRLVGLVRPVTVSSVVLPAAVVTARSVPELSPPKIVENRFVPTGVRSCGYKSTELMSLTSDTFDNRVRDSSTSTPSPPPKICARRRDEPVNGAHSRDERA